MSEGQPAARTRSRASRAQTTATRVFALLFAIGITVAIVYFSDQLERFANYGYLGVFLISVAGNATLVLPAPFLLLVYAMGAVLNPFLVGALAGVGGTLGELTGYMAGFSGRALIENRERYDQITGWMHRNGALTILILALIPNPLFDIAGMAAGALRYPLWRVLVFCVMGKIVKTTLVALAGAQSIAFIEQLLY